MSREIRKVPENWEHPKKSNGEYHPMHDEFYGDVLNEWIENNKKWADGTHQDLIDNPALKEEYPFFSMWSDDAPDVAYYQTVKYPAEQLTHIQLYEDCSEGTPVSPVFKADEFEKLCEYAAENCTTFADFKASKEDWMKMLEDGLVYHQQGNAIFL
jgi:hypothetical protein